MAPDETGTTKDEMSLACSQKMLRSMRRPGVTYAAQIRPASRNARQSHTCPLDVNITQ